MIDDKVYLDFVGWRMGFHIKRVEHFEVNHEYFEIKNFNRKICVLKTQLRYSFFTNLTFMNTYDHNSEFSTWPGENSKRIT